MNRRQFILPAVIVVLLAFSAFLWMGWRNEQLLSVDYPNGTQWICQNTGCGKAFSLSIDELIAVKKAGGDPRHAPCPSCASTVTERAAICDRCRKPYPVSEGKARNRKCPFCGG